MLAISFYQILIEFGIAFLFFLFVTVLGWQLIKKFGSAEMKAISSAYGKLFWSFLAGLLVLIYIYSIVITGGLTINLLLLLILCFLFRKNHTQAFAIPSSTKLSPLLFAESAAIIFILILILHFFPESEYKQADAFFYLKIAEGLNATGQENISHHFNIYSSNYHGLEPYHYFEIWITAFIIRWTENFYSSINVHRFVTQALLLTGVIAGLYYLAEEVLKEKLSNIQKLFCWSLLFILPNILVFSSWLYKIFISDFEGNALERPNFRIIYLLLVPIIIELYKKRPLKAKTTYLLLLLAVVSFQCTVVVIPAMVAYNCYHLIFLKKEKNRFIWLPIIIFSLLFGLIYFLFPVRGIPAFYSAESRSFILQTIKSWKFILFSSVMSAIYILLIVALFLLPLIVFFKRQSLESWEVIKRFKFLLFVAAVGLLMARVFFLKDNAYQFLFVAHIIATLFIWVAYLLTLKNIRTPFVYLSTALFLAALFFIKLIFPGGNFVNTFSQNGNFVYNGKKYSDRYLREVNDFFMENKNVVGAYSADSNFYKATYYSRRNPNVYFLPITYIVSVNHNRNFEFCLSDSSTIMIDEANPVFKDYLNNAIHRSFFYQFTTAHVGLRYDQLIDLFVKEYKLSYLFVTSDFTPGPLLLTRVKREITDDATGEKFLILR